LHLQVQNRIQAPPELTLKQTPRIFDITEISLSNFLPNSLDEECIQKEIKYLMAKDLCRYCPELKWMDSLLEKHIPHPYDQITSQKSNVVILIRFIY